MKNSLCEKIMWYVLSPTIFKFIKQYWKDIDIKNVKRISKKNYKDMIKRTPDIGSLRKNPLRVCLTSGILWLSIYEAMEGKMDQEQFGEMVSATMEAPILKKNFQKQKAFDIKTQKKKIEKNKIANAVSDSEFNWNTELILGRDENEYTVIYHRCGLCALGKQEHHEELIPYMCKMDYETIAMMGGVLKRKGTIATGADCCDFYICKKGSKWDK
ncbi:L-2-amino-thiazoline-4-carboxylic acid hydrolase [Parvimonas micra]|uniref:L-2-amino-thiazoline-4-carboxylic acid hydrolase n=2 Tax=Parvimonas micra TaxID=33033 RepID=A0A0B4S2X1_9FIRM|nr:L-2-amino-thiazoline-4-carboxylic acid hydrolase [Parvimonas micra]AIZ37140.1 L-2-amino-thiazoline-4-carboxylic acid hydrolase [Parvimonas micra]